MTRARAWIVASAALLTVPFTVPFTVLLTVLLTVALGASLASAQTPLPAGVTRTAPLFQTVAIACDAERAYARDGEGHVMRWDGSAWTEHAPAPSQSGWGHLLWVGPRGEVVVDSGRTLARWDGRAWQSVAVDPWFGGEGLELDAIAGLATPWVLGRGAIGVTVDGTVRPFDLDRAWYALHDLAVFAPNHVLVAGEGGLLRWDGRAWSRVGTGLDGAVYDLLASGPNDVWALGATGVARWDGRAWTLVSEGLELPVLAPDDFPQRTSHLGGASPNHVYVSTHDRVWRFAGGRWTPLLDASHASGFGSGYGAICATSRQIVIAEGSNALVIERR